MRIDAYSAINQAYMASRPTPVKKPEAVASAYSSDQVQISSFGKDFQVAKQAAVNAPDVREDLVAQMKEKYKGNANVDPASFADVLISRFNQTI